MEFDYQQQINLENCTFEGNASISTPINKRSDSTGSVTPPIKKLSNAGKITESHSGNSTSNMNDLLFKLTDKSINKQYMWKASSPLDKKGWVNDIQDAIEACQSE